MRDVDTIARARFVGKQEIDLSMWATPDLGGLSPKALSQYLARRVAVGMYFDGACDDSIKLEAGIGLRQVNRLIRERCLATHADGREYGWRGLVPNVNLAGYHRKHAITVDCFGRGASGALGLVLLQNPEIANRFKERILRIPPAKKLARKKIAPASHWSWFLDELRNLNFEVDNKWPFNTTTCGYTSICRFVKKFLDQNPRAAAYNAGGPDLAIKLGSGDGVDRPVKKIYQRVEMDAHKLDGIFCVSIPHATGGSVEKVIYRLWVIVILDVESRAVLGYHLCTGREVSHRDVLRTIKKALSPWCRKATGTCKSMYKASAGLPSGCRSFVGAAWDETSVDGALAEAANEVKNVLNDVVGSKLLNPTNSFSARRTKDDRPFIETFFRTLGANGFQTMTNTTGSSPAKKGGVKPEEVAVTSRFQWEYLEELLDALIANYNATPHSSLGQRSPLKFLDYCMSRPDTTIRFIEAEAVNTIMSVRKSCTVKGGAEAGRRPYVNFSGARYTNDLLKDRNDLVGKKIWVVNHFEDDARICRAYTLDGNYLEVLRAAPPWHRLPHSLQVRSYILSLVHQKRFEIAEGTDAIEVFLDFVESQPGSKLPIHPMYLEVRRILVEHHHGIRNLQDELTELNGVPDPSNQGVVAITDKKTTDVTIKARTTARHRTAAYD